MQNLNQHSFQKNQRCHFPLENWAWLKYAVNVIIFLFCLGISLKVLLIHYAAWREEEETICQVWNKDIWMLNDEMYMTNLSIKE